MLGADRFVDAEGLKKAYKKSALLNHPDKKGSTQASVEHFQSIQRAYHILGDAKKRFTLTKIEASTTAMVQKESKWLKLWVNMPPS